MKKFLIINPFGIGDALFTTPVIRALKESYPDSFIGYWCNERVGDLLKSNPDINRVFALSRGDIKRTYKGLKGFAALLNLIREIRSERFDIAFDFSLDSRYGLLSKLAGIRKRIGFNYKNRGRFLTHKKDLEGYSAKHVVEHYADLLKFIGIEPENKSLDLTVYEEAKTRARQRLSGYGIRNSDLIIGVAMGGGASWGPDALYKQWSAKKFAELADRLIKDFNAKVVLLGSSDEIPLASSLRGAIATKPACPVGRQSQKEIASLPSVARNDDNCLIDMTGDLDLGELAAMIKELKVLVCNDGGPLHMAVALNVNTVSMYGPVDDVVYGPYPPASNHAVVKKDLSCRPCYENFRFKGCFNNRRCLEDITVDEVYEKVKALL